MRSVTAFGLFALFAALIGCGGKGGGGGGGGTTGCTPPSVTPTIGSATVTGRIVADTTGLGASAVQVRFFNGAGAQVGMATTDTCGYFVAVIPSSAVRFHLNPSSINASFFYRQYDYNGRSYAATIGTCTAPLPPVADGTITPMAGTVRLKSTALPPPPPPDGCT